VVAHNGVSVPYQLHCWPEVLADDEDDEDLPMLEVE
jgi:hypothetical protein